jgi:hypothetical protein
MQRLGITFVNMKQQRQQARAIIIIIIIIADIIVSIMNQSIKAN